MTRRTAMMHDAVPPWALQAIVDAQERRTPRTLMRLKIVLERFGDQLDGDTRRRAQMIAGGHAPIEAMEVVPATPARRRTKRARRAE